MASRGVTMIALGLVLVAGCTTLPPTQFVRLDALRIAWVHTGSETPSVVFQSGLGDGLATWAAVLERLPGNVSAFAYDRPGYGASSPVPREARTPCVVARELREVLRAADVPPPFVLVGHSLGGQYQYAFARLYPEDVAALLLLDPTHPEHWEAMQREAPGAATAVTGLRKIVFTPAMRAEFDGQSACLDGLPPIDGSIVARVLVRTRFEAVEGSDFRNLVRELERKWMALLPSGASRHPVDGAGHYIQTDQPAQVVAQIQDVLGMLPR